MTISGSLTLATQHAFTRGGNTETTLSDFIDIVEALYLKGKHAVAVSFDCSGTFDRISFEAIYFIVFFAWAF